MKSLFKAIIPQIIFALDVYGDESDLWGSGYQFSVGIKCRPISSGRQAGRTSLHTQLLPGLCYLEVLCHGIYSFVRILRCPRRTRSLISGLLYVLTAVATCNGSPDWELPITLLLYASPSDATCRGRLPSLREKERQIDEMHKTEELNERKRDTNREKGRGRSNAFTELSLISSKAST